MMEDFKRPKHFDFLTGSELRDAQFSGIRMNTLTTDYELWLLGSVARVVSLAQMQINPDALNEAIEDVFGLGEVKPMPPHLS
jgi:hypothetical protein